MDPQSLHALHLHQKITMMVNRYEAFADDGQGNPGQPVAFAEQKRMKLKEEVVVYTDSSKQRVLARFKARKVLDLSSGYDVTDGEGRPIGLFRKDFGKSLVNSTWHLEQGGAGFTGRERNHGVAVLRRIWGFLPFVGDLPFPMRYHFDFLRGDGAPAFTVDKKTWLRDQYLVRVQDPHLDRRLVIVQAVALDALQAR